MNFKGTRSFVSYRKGVVKEIRKALEATINFYLPVEKIAMYREREFKHWAHGKPNATNRFAH